MVITQPVYGNYLQFSALVDLCKQMSTKSNDNPAAAMPGEITRVGAYAG
jgi:hypothetical protein